MPTYLIPCLCCDRSTIVLQSIWHKYEASFVLCEECFHLVQQDRLPWSFVLMLLRVRGQIATLANKVLRLEDDVRKLYRSEEDLTEALNR